MYLFASCLQASEEEQYLVDLPATTAVTEAIAVAAEVHNLWWRLNNLCKEVDKLLKQPADGSEAGPAISGIATYPHRQAVCKTDSGTDVH